jgi:hypothetical protein
MVNAVILWIMYCIFIGLLLLGFDNIPDFLYPYINYIEPLILILILVGFVFCVKRSKKG